MGGGGRFGFDYFDTSMIEHYSHEAVRQALVSLEAIDSPAGTRIGEKVASELCTVVDDGTIADRRGSLSVDDEGNETKNTVLIENGILKGYMQDEHNARLMFGGGQVDITSGKFVFSSSEAYLIEDGKITAPVKGATLIGNGPEAMQTISMVGNDMSLDSGVGVCGKDGQSVPVGVGQPTLKMDALTVGGARHWYLHYRSPARVRNGRKTQ